jgi:hypothetical protein
MSRAQFADFINNEVDKWAKIVQLTGVTVN